MLIHLALFSFPVLVHQRIHQKKQTLYYPHMDLTLFLKYYFSEKHRDRVKNKNS